MKRTENELDSRQVLTVIEKYSEALELLDSYDHQNMTRPTGNIATYELTYEECQEVIKNMRFGDESDLFGKGKDDSFRGKDDDRTWNNYQQHQYRDRRSDWPLCRKIIQAGTAGIVK